MASSFGKTLRVTIFGQSHSPAIGCVIEGLPAGFTPNLELLASFMARRAPGHNAWSSPRREADSVEVVSGLNEHGTTCATPLACLIRNTNTRSQDYDDLRRVPRPSHADFTAHAKWGDAHDIRGGGHFSGRLTAPLVAAGGIALQLLASRGVRIAAHLAEIGGVTDEPFKAASTDAQSHECLVGQLDALCDGRPFPVIDLSAGDAMMATIDDARIAKDSVGGIIECVACNVAAGIGGPAFDGIESAIARIAFGVPAVKGLEFGAGFTAARMYGSEHNDPFIVDASGHILPTTNKAGGNLGGITTGAPVLFRMAIKPTPSIARTQRSVDIESKTPKELRIHGRHDPCIVPRAVPVAEAIMALALLDCWLSDPPAAQENSVSPLTNDWYRHERFT